MAPIAPSRAECLGRSLVHVLVGALTVVELVLALAPDAHKIVVAVQGVARFLLLPAHLLTGWSAWRGHRRLAGWSAMLAALQVGLMLVDRGRNRPDVAPAGAVRLRVLSANLLAENPVLERLIGELSGDEADLWALQELTPAHLGTLERAGVLKQFPYQVLDPQTAYFGSGLLSRLPLTDGRVLDLAGSPVTVARVETAGGPVLVVSVHLLNPGAGSQLGDWRRQLEALSDLVGESEIPVVLAGDFNATLDHPALRSLLRSGVRDAFNVAGRGAGATWPRWSSPMPPVMRLDHVLVTSEMLVTGFATRVSSGSDHDRVVADLAVVPEAAGPVG
ncbi:MAG: hypothetical protein JWP61_117 [Friedmanniella sp.]|nr:hypothetical protein [Friedmanniella sp.]